MEEVMTNGRNSLSALLAACLAVGAVSTPALAQHGRTRYDTPTITCKTSSRSTIDITVCAGASGAPAGFSLQWMRLPEGADCSNFQWISGDPGLCKASFSGVPGCSIYNLQAGMCQTVTVGNLNDAQCGVSMDGCGADELACGTTYVFRVFAHANSDHNRSLFSANLCCSTESCGGCTLSQGYWKTHPCDWPPPFAPGPNGSAPSGQCALTSNPNQQCAADPTTTITIGTNSYTMGQLLCALDRAGQGNALVGLAHQLIAAKLNALNGAAVPDEIQDTIDCADALIGSLDIQTAVVQSGRTPAARDMTTKASILEAYNTGEGGVPHCDE
jgi:hypothetical protein